ncbi:MAG: hypothetical protein FJ217_11725 [Ignavibacteria bacterium]|nr:hypothetical protein [Ignavibacteria bacterium]
MGWADDVQQELARAKEAEESGNMGKARTSARRAVGIALSELQRRFPQRYHGQDFIRQMRSFAEDAALPHEVRSAAVRLQARISSDFTSPSLDPVRDAMTIIEYIDDQLS